MTQDEIFSLIDLPYSQDGLKPVINAETVAFHHGKHLAGYVKNLNGLVKGTEYAQMQLEEIVCKASGAVLNNAGQILNHNLYFLQFSGSPKKSAPTGALLDAVNKLLEVSTHLRPNLNKKAPLFLVRVGYGLPKIPTVRS